jgi:hypothetical protein
MTLTKHLGALVLSVVTPMELSTPVETKSTWRLDVPTQVAPQHRAVSNRLAIVDLAPVPEITGQRELKPAQSTETSGCPFYLHAVIESDIASESFALIQRDGEPEIIREGAALRAGSTRFVVRRIARQKLILRQGKRQVQCFLSNEESSQ